MKINDRAVGIAGVIISAFLISTIWNTQFETKAFPVASLIILMILSIILAVRKADKSYALENFKQVVMGFVLILLYIVGLRTIGFIFATILFLVAFVFFNRFEGRKIVVIIYCVALPLLLYAVFQLLFHVRLPQGMI